MNRGARLGARASRPCTCAAIDGEHAFGCPQRPRRGAKAKTRRPMARRREEPRRTDRVEDPVFVELVHLLPCSARSIEGHRCKGPIVAHHAGPRWDHGGSQKCDDDKCIALCDQGHKDLHGNRTSGTFKGYTKPMMRAWQDIQIAQTQPRVESLRADRAAQIKAELGIPW